MSRTLPSETWERLSPLVGRRDERARLEALVDRALSGHGGVALIGGAPGAGKSLLARTVSARARELGMWTFTGHCQETEGRTPYAPYVDILEATLRTFPTPAHFLKATGDSAEAAVRLLPR